MSIYSNLAKFNFSEEELAILIEEIKEYDRLNEKEGFIEEELLNLNEKEDLEEDSEEEFLSKKKRNRKYRKGNSFKQPFKSESNYYYLSSAKKDANRKIRHDNYGKACGASYRKGKDPIISDHMSKNMQFKDRFDTDRSWYKSICK